MRINFNPASATAQRHLVGTQGALLKATQRLSSGLRVNSAADDAAGLAMSQRLRAQIGGMNQARRNVQDGVSYIQTADGGDISIFEFDRVVAHEMVHGLMFRTMDTTTFPDWFVEGTAEYIHGVDDRLKNDLDAIDGNSANGHTAADITTFLNNGWDVATSGSPQYSASYAAVKYLDSKLATAGTSIKSLMGQLEGGSTLDAALTATIGMNAAGFVTGFKTNGVTFIQGLDLTDSDMGGIGGGGGTATVPDLNWDTVQPLNRFKVIWPDGTPEPALTLQAGANNIAADTIDLSGIVISASILGVTGLDLQEKAGEALDLIDSAITGVASGRARLGAIQNRLEYALTSLGVGAENMLAADSRIRDADVAATMADFVRTQLLQNTGLAALSQANAAPSLVTALLN